VFQEVEVVAWTDGTYPVWTAVTKARTTMISGRIIFLECFLEFIIVSGFFPVSRTKEC